MTRHARRPRAPWLVASLLVLSALSPSIVAAHAELLETSPLADATVAGTPAEISATFSEAIGADSALSLRDAAGDEIASGGQDPADPARLVIGPVPDLAPGTYKVRWTSVTDDGHVERDTWSFTVTAAPTPSPSPSPSPTPEASASATPEPTTTAPPSSSAAPSPTADGGDPAADGGDALLPIIVGLVLVGLVAGYLVTRRGRPAPPA